jgi:predicted unusual protein kinase regulating ubiquinone biosynthesis (AarF/ABC1/UbiB family)
MWWVLFSEMCRYAWTWDYSEFVKSTSTRLMRENLVYTKVFQALVAKFAPCDSGHNIPYPADEATPLSMDGLTWGSVIGSGMVAVVYTGQADGHPVVIKVKRKNIKAILLDGLQEIKETLTLLDYIPFLKKFCLMEIHSDVTEMLLDQLDFEQEVRHQKRFSGMFAYNKNIVVPTVYDKWCTADQIVMERLEGMPFDEVTNREAHAELFSQVIVKCAVIDGFVHCDMHLGNTIFMRDGRIGIIDYGLMLDLTKQQQDAYIGLSSFMRQEKFEEAALFTINTYFTWQTRSPREPELIEKIAAIIRNSRKIQTFGVLQISQMSSAARPYGYKVSPFFYKIVVSMAASDALLQELSPMSLDLLLNHVGSLIE